MNNFDKMLREKAAEEKITVPENVNNEIEKTLKQLPEKKIKISNIRIFRRIASAAACFVFFMLFLLPNISETYAQSFDNVPVLSDFIRVITIRNYFYSDDYHEMRVDIPNIDDSKNQQAAENINRDITELTERIIREFYDEVEEIGDEGHGSVYVDYCVVTNTDKWFTLKLTVTSVRGSGSVYFKYYHIDRVTGKNVFLSDLFETDDYNSIITEDIKEQMRSRMKADSDLTYWIDGNDFGYDFPSVNSNHNFYFDSDGNLVIPFDKYEVAPGYMGHPEFVIEKSKISKILKSNYKNILE